MTTLSQHTQGARDDWPFVLFCNHESAAETASDAITNHFAFGPQQAEGERLAEKVEALFVKAPHSFDDGEVGELSSWVTGSGAACTWRCPVCGEEHEEETDAADFIDPD